MIILKRAINYSVVVYCARTFIYSVPVANRLHNIRTQRHTTVICLNIRLCVTDWPQIMSLFFANKYFTALLMALSNTNLTLSG